MAGTLSAAADLRVRPYLLWQLPTLCLTAAVAVGLVVGQPGTYASTSTVLGAVLMALSTLAAALVPWSRLPAHVCVVLPLSSVAAIALMGLEAFPVMPSVGLIGVIPALWLVYDFGRPGIALAVLSIIVLAGAAYISEGSLPSTLVGWAQFVILPTVALCLCLGARQVARLLDRNRVTLLKQTEQLEHTLQESYDRLLLVQAVLDTVQAGIVAYDNSGELILENEYAGAMAARANFRLDQPSATGNAHVYFEDRVTPVPVNEQVISRARRGEEVPAQTRWYGPPGDQFAVILSAGQMHRRDGGRFGTVVVGWDVTDILEAARVREEFLTTVSHELRTPLTSIIGYQELIADELADDNPQLATMLRIAQRNAAVLLSRVSQLLQAADEDLQINPRPVDLSALVQVAVTKHQPTADLAEVQIASAIEPGISANVDPDAWEQVIDNLVSNAIKYTPAGGSVQVALRPAFERFQMSVTDTGIGMSTKEQQRVFERFYRTTSARDLAIQGLGIGLSITKRIVDAHGGDLSLSSVPGQGTETTVHAPMLEHQP